MAHLQLSKTQNFLKTKTAVHRSGFTLMEIILALAILVMVTAAAAPYMIRMFDGSRLENSAEIVQAEMNRARVRAVRTGQEWAFYFYPGTPYYTVVPYSPFTPMPNMNVVDSQTQTQYGNGVLPSGVTFATGQAEIDERAMDTVEVVGQGNGSNGGTMVLFYPDGTAQNAVVYLRHERGWIAKLQVRGLTGSVVKVDVEELQP